MLYSNYNVLTLSHKMDGKYKVGDKYVSITKHNWREQRFSGLEIKSIDYCFGVRLYFDLNDWNLNMKKL